MVTASADKTARVWDAETGKPVGEAMTHGEVVASASFSPDGKRVVTASEDKTARVWDAETGKPVGEAMTHGAGVLSASFSPDGKRVVTASEDKTARVWDAETGKPVGEAMTHAARSTPPASAPTASAWSRRRGQDGPHLGRRDRQARGRADDARRTVDSASFSPDGKRVVTASLDKTARIWDAETGKPVGEAMTHGGGSTPPASAPTASAWSRRRRTRRPASGTPRPASPWASR